VNLHEISILSQLRNGLQHLPDWQMIFSGRYSRTNKFKVAEGVRLRGQAPTLGAQIVRGENVRLGGDIALLKNLADGVADGRAASAHKCKY
jgi:hypothetical protein